MNNNDQNKRNIEKLFYGGILFGITISIGFFILVHFGSQIEFQREHSSLFVDILFWLLEWVVIIVGIGLPWIIWKKLVKPYKTF